MAGLALIQKVSRLEAEVAALNAKLAACALAGFIDERGEVVKVVGKLRKTKDGAIVLPGEWVSLDPSVNMSGRYRVSVEYTVPVAVPDLEGGYRDLTVEECVAAAESAAAKERSPDGR